MEVTGLWCQGASCAFTLPVEEVAVAAGWSQVHGEWLCGVHAPVARVKARHKAARAAQRTYRNQQVAKKMLSAAEYRAWGEFQADLANFHREHGRPAHRTLRMMNPAVWSTEFREKGKIDVVKSTENLEVLDRDGLGAMLRYMRGS